MTDYSLGDVARILKVSPRRLRYWKKTRLVGRAVEAPTNEAPAEAGYGFRDLVVLRAIVSMVERGIPVQRIRRDLDALRERLPELGDPGAALRVATEDGRSLVLRRDGRWEEAGGQLLLEFEAQASAAIVAPVRTLANDDAGAVEVADPSAGPSGAQGWFEQGCALDVDEKKWSDAAAAYERAIEIDPEHADAYCNLGAVRYNQGQRAAARRAFESCLERVADHVEANFNLANMLEEAGEDERALTLYRRALAVDPVYPDLHINLALLYEKLDRASAACRHWRRYLQIDPQGSWSTVARQRLARESEQA